jgi:SAM-dependent methyltransferase
VRILDAALFLAACGGSTVLAACGGVAGPPSPAGPPHDHDHDHGGMVHDFTDVGRWVAVFDDPARDAWQHPAEVVAKMELRPGMTVVDLGAGTGYFEPHLARAVGAGGHVLALDAEPKLVAYLGERARREGLGNVEARVVAPDEPGLAPGSVDRVLIVDTWHHLGDRPAYARKLAAALRPGGSVVVVDFTQTTAMGPPVQHRIPPDQVAAELGAAGLGARVIDESLPEQFIVVGTRAP